MLIATSTSEARQKQRLVHVNGKDYTLSEYVGAAPVRGKYVEGNEVNDNGLPQGFLVEQPPGSVTLPHFHETNQFQVFVDGSGSMGKHAAEPLTVQYANGHTPYGPIAAGANGVTYFTLRQRWDQVPSTCRVRGTNSRKAIREHASKVVFPRLMRKRALHCFDPKQRSSLNLSQTVWPLGSTGSGQDSSAKCLLLLVQADSISW